ncbi:MAG: efflux RND transporter permease subunit [Verrucomicrobia bacterium]|nr:efflux RND transporter permease subunit [Verrucomicrobiota bacterium]
MPVWLIRWSAAHPILVIGLAAALALLGLWTAPRQQLDAIPDASDTQVILAVRWEQPPDLVEAQVTYPLTTALLGTPKVTSVRGFTDAGLALIYVLFEDGTDLYWARSRVAEMLSRTTSVLPAGAHVEMGPDATGVGWVFQYALVDNTGKQSLAELRAVQDWTLRYALQATPGVAEVATVGGFEKEYQVTVQPGALEQYHLTFKAVVDAVRNSTMETGGQQIELSGRNFTVRGRGLAHTVNDLENAVVYGQNATTDLTAGMVPVRLGDIAQIELVPRSRQGLCDLDGKGEVVGGVVVMRQGQNALEVIHRVKERLQALAPSLPPGVRIVTTYDRSELIRRSIKTLERELLLAACAVSLVICISLRDAIPALVAVMVIPATLLISLLPMLWFGLNLNIMSIGGIILSIGVLVDGAIIQVENVHRKLQTAGGGRIKVLRALEEVTPAIFLSLLSITVTFFPIFALTGQEGRLFQPLAAAKTTVMVTAALMTLTLAPALRVLFFHGSTRPSLTKAGPSSPAAFRPKLYERTVRLALRFPAITIAGAALLFVATVPVYFQLGREFMPPLNEETVLYMPTMLPGVSATQALQVLQRQDAVLASFPEVVRVYGKAGRAQTATDPAPLSMIETTLVLKPPEQWRERRRWYSGWSPEWLKRLLFRRLASDRITYDQLVSEMNRAVTLPGVINSWTMPIRGRIDMLTSGARTPLAVKVSGPDLKTAQQIGEQVEACLQRVAGTRSALAERPAEGYFIDIQIDRERLANRRLQVADVQEVVAGAIGGEPAAEIFEGGGRYPVTVRYPKRFRDNLDAIGRITVVTEDGERVPLEEVATIRPVRDTGTIRTEGGMLAAYVFVDCDADDIGHYVGRAQQAISQTVKVPPGYLLQWSGEYENMMRARQRLQVVVPVTLLLLLVLLYLNTQSWIKTSIVLLAVPFSLVGAVWLLYALGYNLSVATWVGMIALVGLDAETGVFMLLFLDLAYAEARRQGSLSQPQGLADAVVDGAARRLRPKLMTVAAAFMGLLPAMLSTGTGSDVTKRIVAPMIGGLAASFILELLVYPPIYFLWRRRTDGPHATAQREKSPIAM